MKALAVGAIGAGCIMAAGVGGFLAQRMGQDDTARGVAAQAVPDAADATAATVAATDVIDAAAAPVDPADAATAVRPPETRPVAPAPVPRTAPEPVRPAPAPAPEPIARPEPPPPVVTTPVSVPASGTSDAQLPPPPPPVPDVPLLPDLPEEPAMPELIELRIEEGEVIGIRLDERVSTEVAEVEDRLTATIVRDVDVNGRTAIPAGARLEGVVTLVEAGGRFRERARIGVQFTTLMLSETTELRIQTAPIYRQGESPAGEATAKIGASAVVGAILGGLIGGKKGATIGGAAGAAGGSAAVARGGRNDVTLEEGTPLTVRLAEPLVLLVERRQQER